eukprot:2740764-Alexandrium_andersonii.AAC.1
MPINKGWASPAIAASRRAAKGAPCATPSSRRRRASAARGSAVECCSKLTMARRSLTCAGAWRARSRTRVAPPAFR